MQDSGPAVGQTLAQPDRSVEPGLLLLVAELVRPQRAQLEEQVLVRLAAEQARVHKASNRPATADQIPRGWRTVFVALSHLSALREAEPAVGQVQAQRERLEGQVLAARVAERVQV
jgi:hypothetical protein